MLYKDEQTTLQEIRQA
jgi:hypothetical protein